MYSYNKKYANYFNSLLSPITLSYADSQQSGKRMIDMPPYSALNITSMPVMHIKLGEEQILFVHDGFYLTGTVLLKKQTIKFSLLKHINITAETGMFGCFDVTQDDVTISLFHPNKTQRPILKDIMEKYISYMTPVLQNGAFANMPVHALPESQSNGTETNVHNSIPAVTPDSSIINSNPLPTAAIIVNIAPYSGDLKIEAVKIIKDHSNLSLANARNIAEQGGTIPFNSESEANNFINQYAANGGSAETINPSNPTVAKETAPAQTQTIDVVAEIKKYKELLDIGAITQEEYDAKKKSLLNL